MLFKRVIGGWAGSLDAGRALIMLQHDSCIEASRDLTAPRTAPVPRFLRHPALGRYRAQSGSSGAQSLSGHHASVFVTSTGGCCS